jgi:anti-repressor protein
MNGLQVFQKDALKVRTIIKDGESWFVAADVCKELDIRSDTVPVILDEDEYMKVDPNSIGVKVNAPNGMTLLSEAGLYTLIIKSRKPAAHLFKRWVTHEVIPSIRKYGVYASMLPRTMSESLRLCASLVDQVEAQAKVIEYQAPMVAVAEKIASADNCLTIKDFAKSLGEGPVKIFGKLERLGVIYRNSEMDWVPYQRFLDAGYFRTKITTIPHGTKTVNHTTALVTGKGEVWLAQKLGEAS